MKKIIVVFIAISMLLASLAGSFTPVASVRAKTLPFMGFTLTPGASAKADDVTITGTIIFIVQTIPASSQAFNCVTNIGSVPESFTLIAGNKKVFYNALIGTKLAVGIEEPEGYVVANFSSIPVLNKSFTPKQGQTGTWTITFKAISTITFDAQGGTPTPAPIMGIVYGTTITLPKTPLKAGFTFKGWNTRANGTGATFTATTKVIADETVYAIYIPIPIYTITFDAQGGTPTPAPITARAGTTITLPEAPTKASFAFVNWNTSADGTGTTFNATTPVLANATVYATYVGTVTIFVYYQPLFLGYPNGTFKQEKAVTGAEVAEALTRADNLILPIKGKVLSFEVRYFKSLIFTIPFLSVLSANNSPVLGARQGLIGAQGQIPTPSSVTSLEVKKCYFSTLLFNTIILALRRY